VVKRTAQHVWLVAAVLLWGGLARGQDIIFLQDLTLGPNDVLPAKIGGLNPGQSGHDQYQVQTDALLDGRLELQLINGFEPQVGDQVRLIQAAVVDGEFASHFLPNALPAGIAVDFQQSSQFFDVRFVSPTIGPTFANSTPISAWSSNETWSGFQIPESTDILEVTNNLGSGNQTVVVLPGTMAGGGPAQVHDLRVAGNGVGSGMTLRVAAGASLSASQNLLVDSSARLQVLGGTVAANEASVRQGGLVVIDRGLLVTGKSGLFVEGQLRAHGTISGGLVAGFGGSLSPGIETEETIGDLIVDGNYTQKRGSTLNIDIQGLVTGEVDQVLVSGGAVIEGNLAVDFTQVSAQIGSKFDFFNAGQIFSTSRFDQITTTGLPIGAYAAPQYTQTSISMLISSAGDMNADGLIDEADVDLFAMALRSREDYFNYDDGFGPLGIEADISGDTDYDGDLDFDDIDNLISLLTPPAALYAQQQLLGVAIPEPSTVTLIMIGVLGLGAERWRKGGMVVSAARKLP